MRSTVYIQESELFGKNILFVLISFANRRFHCEIMSYGRWYFV